VTRRITLTMVAVVAGALLVASLATLVLSRAADRREARVELGRQAERLAGATRDPGSPPVLGAVRIALRLEGDAVLRFGPGGRSPDPPPEGITLADLSLDRLRQGDTVTGAKGSLVFAAAPAQRGNVLLVVVLTRRVGGGGVGPLILVVGLATLAVAAAVAANLGRRLVRPLREAREATGRIAAGDLAARAAVRPHDGEELAGLAASINAMAASLERSRGLERQFLMSVSHDLRTPLTSIRGYAEALSEGRAPDPAQAAAVIRTESRRLERLVTDLLELARLGARQFSLDLRRTDVAEVVADTADGFRPAAEAADVALHVDVPDERGLPARSDPDRLAQVVANLVENALGFARSRVAVGARSHDGVVEVWVEDDGPGIRGDDLRHVFEPFYRSDPPPPRRVGTGLGLAIVRELVVAMDGSVRVVPVDGGGGARMVVTVPAWPART
jgi:two-component system OmpR family sensor kinase